MLHVRFGSVLLVILAGAGAQPLQARTELPVVGSSGASFTDECPTGQYLVGLNARRGEHVDQVQIICASVQPGATLGQELHYGPERGGRTGTPLESACRNAITTGADFAMAPSNRQLANVELACRSLRTGETDRLSFVRSTGGAGRGLGTQYRQECPEGEYVIGIRGRADDYVAALGLICEADDSLFVGAPQSRSAPAAPAPERIAQFDSPFESESTLGGKFDVTFQVVGRYANPPRFHVTGTITNTDIGPQYNGTFDGTAPVDDPRTVSLSYTQPGANARGTVVFRFSEDGATFTGDGRHMGQTPFTWTGRRKRAN